MERSRRRGGSGQGARRRRRSRRRGPWKRIGVAAAIVAGVALVVLGSPIVFIAMHCVGSGSRGPVRSAEVLRAAADVRGYFRDESATYLTVPEWSIVYSTEEYASTLEQRAPSQFPYLAAIRQYWSYYGDVCRVTRGAYPFDTSDHLMLALVGLVFSAEHVAKAGYENTAGRVTEWMASSRTEEDAFAARTARDYARFMHAGPWYEFPFGTTLIGLWRETPLWGSGMIRKWERKLVLSAEYAGKAIYGWLMSQGIDAVYGAEDPEVHAWLEGPADAVFADTRVRKVKDVAPNAWLVGLPRYAAFTDVMTGLARRSVRVHDVAGNGTIVLTATAPRDWTLPPGAGDPVFARPLLTDPATKRLGVKAPVTSLHAILAALETRGARVEHLYDY